MSVPIYLDETENIKYEEEKKFFYSVISQCEATIEDMKNLHEFFEDCKKNFCQDGDKSNKIIEQCKQTFGFYDQTNEENVEISNDGLQNIAKGVVMIEEEQNEGDINALNSGISNNIPIIVK